MYDQEPESTLHFYIILFANPYVSINSTATDMLTGVQHNVSSSGILISFV